MMAIRTAELKVGRTEMKFMEVKVTESEVMAAVTMVDGETVLEPA
jgi:hypothetical protein